MRIAIYENLPPGGAKRAAFELGRYLATHHDIELHRLSITDNRLFDLGPLARQVYVHRYSPLRGALDARLKAGHYAPRSYTLFGPLRRLHRRIAADIRGRRYDVVLAHTDAMTQSPYLLRWLAPQPNVYYCQEVLRVREETTALRLHRRRLAASRFPLGTLRLLEDAIVLPRLEAADRTNAAAAGAIVVNSKYSRERVRAAYGRDAITSYLGVDISRFRPDPAVSRVPEVLSIGSPALLKGHDLVIDALSQIEAGRRPRLRVITAPGPDAQTLSRLAVERGVELALEHGLDEARLIHRYQSALATICASRLEPFGLTAVESMACGTPVIAIDEAGYRETVRDGVTGHLVEPTAAALGGALSSLVQEPQAAARLGAAGPPWVAQHWTWDRAGQRLEAVLERTVAGGHGDDVRD